MAFNKSAAAAFANIAGNNPLNDLSSRDKETLWALITTYDGSTKNTPSTDPVEVVRKIAREAGILADRIERELFLSPMAQVFVPHMSGDKDLPVRLTNFSKELIRLIGLTGKPGHHATTFSTQLLITASEFVKLTTDRYNDEHLAELIQSILDKPDFVDLSGDAIRKRRQNFADGYPVLYEFAKTTAKTLSLDLKAVRPITEMIASITGDDNRTGSVARHLQGHHRHGPRRPRKGPRSSAEPQPGR